MGLAQYLTVVAAIIALGNCKYEVTLKQGVLRGTEMETLSGRKIAGFLGVPYAKPPGRFEKSEMAGPWKGIWNATSPHSDCMTHSQLTYRSQPEWEVHGVEDCLYLDVYTPRLPKDGEKLKFKVVVYIHPGSFMFMYGGHNGPKYLLDRHDIIFIHVNYRLGALGFLSTGDDVVPGNNGLKDQSLALRWVYENIEKFGGDPDTITLMGCSAGAAGVHYHYLSPMSKGLFNKGMSMGASVFSPFALVPQEAAKERGRKLAELVGCPTSPSSEMVDCLKSRPARELILRTSHFLKWYYNPFTVYGPVIEPEGKDRFITELPYEILRSGKAYDVPWLVTFTKTEGLYPAAEFISNKTAMKELGERWNEIAPYYFFYSHTSPKSKHDEISQIIRDFYFKDKNFEDSVEEIIEVGGDRFFQAYIVHAAKLQAKVNKSPVYSYQFSYRGKYSTSQTLSGGINTNWGSSHGEDSGYIAQIKGMIPEETENDIAISRLLIDMVAAYVNTSVPTIDGKPWDPVCTNLPDYTYLHIESPTKFGQATKSEIGHENFWMGLELNELEKATKKY